MSRHRAVRVPSGRLSIVVNALLTVLVVGAAIWVLATAGAAALSSCSMPAIRCR